MTGLSRTHIIFVSDQDPPKLPLRVTSLVVKLLQANIRVAIAHASTLAAIQYTTVAVAKLVIGGIMGELWLEFVAEAPGVPVIIELPDAGPVGLCGISESDTTMVIESSAVEAVLVDDEVTLKVVEDADNDDRLVVVTPVMEDEECEAVMITLGATLPVLDSPSEPADNADGKFLVVLDDNAADEELVMTLVSFAPS